MHPINLEDSEKHNITTCTCQRLYEIEVADLSDAVVNISEEILKVKQEVEVEFSGIDPGWGHGESNVPNQAQGRYSETDNRDWRNRPAQFPVPGVERPWEAIRDRDLVVGLIQGNQK
ncbi:unnamed protein product [Fraxinus pennsylvanica]|uniref:Uncharacterized protein n=1 Tax=Fraxinus pennsylvanica TaxID=56036 RepID=A0AAD2ABB2_9LAMI|nr:unnamed protein product [Fraxinus pennsylvanica]